MSRDDYISGWPEMSEPLQKEQVDGLVKRVMFSGSVGFIRHARDEMRNDDLGEIDIRNALKNGSCFDFRLKDETWRYRIRTQEITVIVSFRTESQLTVVTAWKGRIRNEW